MENVIDLFDLINQRAKLLDSYVKNKITKEEFEKELERINELIVDF